ncbi:hypothetical protein ABZO31_16255 [Streptomyces sp. HUAS MG47]|uniref:hypothetical protein n=1 Tax=Streptomyces solicamelliae TaxID=3231716 RepID=UPI00387815B7
MNLRVIGLGAAVVCAVLVPLAAFAGEGGGEKRGLLSVVRTPASENRTEPRTRAEKNGTRAENGTESRTARETTSPTPAAAPPPRSSVCGPELTSPDGIEAQTCVLTEGTETWGRTYYRNASGRELAAVLTLMSPGGRTVQMHCAVSAADEPGACETPRERTREPVSEYSAVAEFAGAGEGDSTPLLLRSGSNALASKGS